MSVKWYKLLNKLRLLFVQRGDSTNKLKQKVKNMKHLKKSTTKKITHDSTLKLGLSSCSIYISFYVVSNVVKGSRWDPEWSKLQEQEKHNEQAGQTLLFEVQKHFCNISECWNRIFQNQKSSSYNGRASLRAFYEGKRSATRQEKCTTKYYQGSKGQKYSQQDSKGCSIPCERWKLKLEIS